MGVCFFIMENEHSTKPKKNTPRAEARGVLFSHLSWDAIYLLGLATFLPSALYHSSLQMM
jgi:hypothetical protein